MASRTVRNRTSSPVRHLDFTLNFTGSQETAQIKVWKPQLGQAPGLPRGEDISDVCPDAVRRMGVGVSSRYPGLGENDRPETRVRCRSCKFSGLDESKVFLVTLGRYVVF